MGSYNTKNEEVIIAQQGANNAKQVSDIQNKLENYGLTIIVIGIALAAMCICLCGRQCCSSARKWLRKELKSLWSEGPATTAAQQATIPQASYA